MVPKRVPERSQKGCKKGPRKGAKLTPRGAPGERPGSARAARPRANFGPPGGAEFYSIIYARAGVQSDLLQTLCYAIVQVIEFYSIIQAFCSILGLQAIGYQAFCSILGLQAIGYQAFYSILGLQAIGYQAFCSTLGLQAIGYQAFCSVLDLQAIGYQAFCSISSLPEGLLGPPLPPLKNFKISRLPGVVNSLPICFMI